MGSYRLQSPALVGITWESWHTVRNAEIDLEHIDDDHHRHDQRTD